MQKQMCAFVKILSYPLPLFIVLEETYFCLGISEVFYSFMYFAMFITVHNDRENTLQSHKALKHLLMLPNGTMFADKGGVNLFQLIVFTRNFAVTNPFY